MSIRGILLSGAAAGLLIGPALAEPVKPAETTNTGQPNVKMSDSQCSTLWTQALAGASGDLAMDKAKPYVKDFKTTDKNGDNKLSQAEWTEACNQGWVESTPARAAGPGGATSDRTPGKPADREHGSSVTGAPETDAAQTPGGTSDRTPSR